MKKLSVIIILCVLVVSACKKKHKTQETETPVVVTPAPVVPDEFSVFVDDTSYACKNCSSSFLTGGMRGIYFGDHNTTTHQFRFYFDSMPKAGSYDLRENSDPRMTYVKAFTYYKVTSGLLTITAVDTASDGSIKKLTGSFSAKTDTTYGPSYRIFKLTKGVLHLDYK